MKNKSVSIHSKEEDNNIDDVDEDDESSNFASLCAFWSLIQIQTKNYQF